MPPSAASTTPMMSPNAKYLISRISRTEAYRIPPLLHSSILWQFAALQDTRLFCSLRSLVQCDRCDKNIGVLCD
jgi:hypothetical protein